MQVNFVYDDNTMVSVNDVQKVEDIGRYIKVTTLRGLRYLEKHGWKYQSSEKAPYQPAMMYYEKIRAGIVEGKNKLVVDHVDVNGKTFPR